MGGIPGQVQPPVAEPVGDAVLHPDPRGPGKAGDLRAKARLVHQRLQLCGGDRGTELPGRQLIGAGRPGREQSPGRSLAKAEHEQQPSPPGYDVGGATGEITRELGVGEDDLNGVWAPGPADAGLGPHGAGRAVAAGDEIEEDLSRLGP